MYNGGPQFGASFQEQKEYMDKTVQTEYSFPLRRKLNLDRSDCMSTPPSELRKEIFCLVNELQEAHEFHDLELQILKEENCCISVDDNKQRDFEEILKDAEETIFQSKKEIEDLENMNKDLKKKLKDESNQTLILKEQYNNEISRLQSSLKMKMSEIEKLEKDKNDNEVKIEVLRANYNRKINELTSALESMNEKESKNEENALSDILERKLAEENAKSQKLSDRIKELNAELQELKAEKNRLNTIIASKDKNLTEVLSELNETKEKLEESKIHFNTRTKDTEYHIELLLTEKIELQNWIKTKEEEFRDLDLMVEEKLEILRTSSESDMEQLKKFYEEEIKSLKNDNELLSEQIISIQALYDTELSKFVKLIETEKTKNGMDASLQSTLSSYGKYESEEKITSVQEERSNTANECAAGPNVDFKVEGCECEGSSGHLTDFSAVDTGYRSMKLNGMHRNEVSSRISVIVPSPRSSTVELPALVSVLVKQDQSGLIDEENIGQITEDKNMINMNMINSEDKLPELLNELDKDLVKENIMSAYESGAGSIFYSLANNYSVPYEIYLRLKNEFYEYRLSKEKECYETLNKTARYLETLCSQLEGSENSLNLSNASFVSFKEGLPSSTIADDFSEMEISNINDITMTVCNDPLALSQNLMFQTPLTTPLRSNKEAQQLQLKTPLRINSKAAHIRLKVSADSPEGNICRTPFISKPERTLNETRMMQATNSVSKKEREIGKIKNMYDRKLSKSEDVIVEIQKSFSSFEERISKLERVNHDFTMEKEILIKENRSLKENLAKVVEENTDVKQKLIVEIVSLNPESEGTLSGLPAPDILSLFLNTIMESFKKIPEESSKKLLAEIQNLNNKNEIYENKIIEMTKQLERIQDENNMLISETGEAKKSRLDLTDEVTDLRLESSEFNAIKIKVRDLEEKLEDSDRVIRTEIYRRNNALKDREKLQSLFENFERENSDLKDKIEKFGKMICDLKKELVFAKRDQMDNQAKAEELMKEIEYLMSILSAAEEKNKDFETAVHNLEGEMNAVMCCEGRRHCEIELLIEKVVNAEKLILERNHCFLEMKQNILGMQRKLNIYSKENIICNVDYKNAQLDVEQVPETFNVCNETDHVIMEEIQRILSKLEVAVIDLSSKAAMIERLSAQLEEADHGASVREEIISRLKQSLEELQHDKPVLKSLQNELEKCREMGKVMGQELEMLKTKVTSSESQIASKNHLIEELSKQLDEVKDVKLKNEEVISRMSEQVLELKTARDELQRMERTLEMSKEKELLLNGNIENLNSKILQSAAVLDEKMNLIEKLSDEVDKAKKSKGEDEKTISSLMEQIRKMESDKAGELSLFVAKCKEMSEFIIEKVAMLRMHIELDETGAREEKSLVAEETNCFYEEVNYQRQEETISALKEPIKELMISKMKLESLDDLLQKQREYNKQKSREVQNLNMKLDALEGELNAKIDMAGKLSTQLQETERLRSIDKKTITDLNSEIEGLKSHIQEVEALQKLLDDTIRERNEKEMLIKNLSKRLDEVSSSEQFLYSEICLLRTKLGEADENLKSTTEELAKMIEVENELSKCTEVLDQLRTENARLKEVESELRSLNGELEAAKVLNGELEALNARLSGKLLQHSEELSEQNSREINCLKDKLSESENSLASSRATTEQLQNEVEDLKAKMVTLEEVTAILQPKLSELEGQLETESTKRRELEKETVDLIEQLRESNERKNHLLLILTNLQSGLHLVLNAGPELNVGTVEWCKIYEENVNHWLLLRNKELESLKSEVKTLQQQNKDLTKEIDFLNRKDLSVNDVLVNNLEAFRESNDAKVTVKFRNEVGPISGVFERLENVVNGLRSTLLNLEMALAMPEQPSNSREIIDDINKLIGDLWQELLLNRMTILRQEYQHFDDNNKPFHQDIERLSEENNSYKAKIEEFEKLVEGLNNELAALRPKGKFNKKNELWNRKLDKLEELNQSLTDLLTKMLTLTGMENVEKLNLFSVRMFESERKRIFDHFNNWLTARNQELKELKTLVEELDGECDSYAKRIKKAEEETVKVWEEGRVECKELQLKIEELEGKLKYLTSEKEAAKGGELAQSKKKIGNLAEEKNGESCCVKCKHCTKEISRLVEQEDLWKKNSELSSRITHLELELGQSKKQIEELDEECEAYAKVIREADKETLKAWKESRVEVEALKSQVEKLQTILESERKNRREEKHFCGMAVKSDPQDSRDSCQCHQMVQEVKELKTAIGLREMKILELEQLNEKNILHKSQITYLEHSLAAAKEQLAEEKKYNLRLKTDLEDLLNKTGEIGRKRRAEGEIFEKLIVQKNSPSAGEQKSEDQERLQKLENDIQMLKKLCRTRNKEIKRLESENLSLKGHERATK